MAKSLKTLYGSLFRNYGSHIRKSLKTLTEVLRKSGPPYGVVVALARQPHPKGI